MIEQCITVNLLAPANIISTVIEISPTSCVEPCEIQVTVTWENTGDLAGLSDLSITVSGDTPIISPSIYSSIAFAESGTIGDTIIRTFTVSNLAAGIHIINTYPAGAEPRTIEVTEAPVMEAGLNEKDKLVMIGLYIGLAFKAIEKWKDMSKQPSGTTL